MLRKSAELKIHNALRCQPQAVTTEWRLKTSSGLARETEADPALAPSATRGSQSHQIASWATRFMRSAAAVLMGFCAMAGTEPPAGTERLLVPGRPLPGNAGRRGAGAEHLEDGVSCYHWCQPSSAQVPGAPLPALMSLHPSPTCKPTSPQASCAENHGVNPLFHTSAPWAN